MFCLFLSYFLDFGVFLFCRWPRLLQSSLHFKPRHLKITLSGARFGKAPTCYRSLPGPSGPSRALRARPESVPASVPRKRGCPRECPTVFFFWALRTSGSGVSNRGLQNIYLHRSAPLLENGLDRPKNRYGRYGFPSFYSIFISTVGVDGARVCFWRFSFLALWAVVVDISQFPVQKVSRDCPRSVRIPFDTPGTLSGRFGHSGARGPKGPRDTPVGHSRGHPRFSETLVGTLPGHFGPEGPGESCSKSGLSQSTELSRYRFPCGLLWREPWKQTFRVKTRSEIWFPKISLCFKVPSSRASWGFIFYFLRCFLDFLDAVLGARKGLSGTQVWRPQSRYTVSHINCRIKFPENQWCRAKSRYTPPPPKSRCRTFLLPPTTVTMNYN